MELQKRPDGIVFVSYRRKDLLRVQPLVDELVKRFTIFMDQSSLIPGRAWRPALVEGLNHARCVLGLMTQNLTDDSVALEEWDRVKARQVLLPVKLDANAQIPFGYGGIQFLDLSDWRGGADGLSRLFVLIQSFPPGPVQEATTSSIDLEVQIGASEDSIKQLRQLADEVGTLGGVLAGNAEPIENVKGALKEIHATCSATLDVIDRFLEPIPQLGQSPLASYLKVPRELRQIVSDKRGHCSRILEYYGRVGGLRDWLKDHAKPGIVKQADKTFEQLANADGDIFANVTSIAATLDLETSAARSLLLNGDGTGAQKRLVGAQQKLLPLEDQLNCFIAEFSSIKSNLGYVNESWPRASS